MTLSQTTEDIRRELATLGIVVNEHEILALQQLDPKLKFTIENAGYVREASLKLDELVRQARQIASYLPVKARSADPVAGEVPNQSANIEGAKSVEAKCIAHLIKGKPLPATLKAKLAWKRNTSNDEDPEPAA